MFIQIANPLYDVVFKYLMEDRESSLLLLSKLLGMDLVDIDFLPQEHTLELDRQPWTVYRLDFSAKIRGADGIVREVMLEVQKAKYLIDIIRFRQYLGKEYASLANVQRGKLETGRLKSLREKAQILRDKKKLKDKKTPDDKQKARAEQLVPLPIISVYVLGYDLEHVTSPVIKVNRQIKDLITGEILVCHETFIESLTHDCYIVQASRLREPYRNDLEQLLSIFDQTTASDDGHRLTVNDERYPKAYKRVLRRLNRAVQEEKVKETMDAEDLYLKELEMNDRLIQEQAEALEQKEGVIEEQALALEEQAEVIGQKEGVIEEQIKVIGQKEGVIEEQVKVIGQKDQALAEQRKTLEEQRKANEEKDRQIAELMRRLALEKT